VSLVFAESDMSYPVHMEICCLLLRLRVAVRISSRYPRHS
jgi:hypothetical protein